jgi:hypothetical protein
MSRILASWSNPLSTVPTTRRHVWAWSAGLLAVLAAVAVAAIWFGRSRGSLSETALEAVPLTSYPVFRAFPRFLLTESGGVLLGWRKTGQR